MSNMKNIDGLRRCYLCDQTFSATSEYFPKDKNRYLGLGYQCKSCAKIKSAEKEKRRLPRVLTNSQKAAKKEWQKEYLLDNWHYARLKAYAQYDKVKNYKHDLTPSWFSENIKCKPCIYCNRTNVRIGCDRINNSIGHVMSNVVPSCGDCNRTRGNHFTHEEMLELGKAIQVIHAKRIID